MKQTILKLIVFTLLISSYSCNQSKELSEYKYASQPDVLSCANIDNKLLKEALYSFENDIVTHYDKQGQNNIQMAYTRYFSDSYRNRANLKAIASEHTINILNVLKTNSNLWDANGTDSNLNYNSDVMACIINNIQDKDLNTTFNALLNTNSLKFSYLQARLQAELRTQYKDKNLCSYLALELFYNKLYNLDFSKADSQPENTNAPQPQPQNKKDDHAGHNH